MLRLERLKVRKYRRIASGTEIVFASSYNVFLGRNATGKTMMLDLIARVLSLDFRGLADEQFDIEFDLRVDGHLVAITIVNSLVDTDIDRPSERSNGLRAVSSATLVMPEDKIRVEVTALGTTVRVDGEPPRAVAPIAITSGGSLAAGLVGALPRPNPLGALLRGFGLRRFDEGTAEFDRIVQETAVDQTVRDAQGGTAVFRGPWSGHLAHFHEVFSQRPAQQVVLSRSHLPFLPDLEALMNLTALEITFDVVQSRRDPSGDTVTYGNMTFRCTRENGSIDTNSVLSYGERRLLALWWTIEKNPDVAIIDEMVNGLHHDWIDASMKRLQTRQSFLTSQNPLLMDFLGFDSAEEVRSTFLLCPGASDAPGAQLPVRNLTLDEAERVYSARRVGIQHVSEILRDQGLW